MTLTFQGHSGSNLTAPLDGMKTPDIKSTISMLRKKFPILNLGKICDFAFKFSDTQLQCKYIANAIRECVLHRLIELVTKRVVYVRHILFVYKWHTQCGPCIGTMLICQCAYYLPYFTEYLMHRNFPSAVMAEIHFFFD